MAKAEAKEFGCALFRTDTDILDRRDQIGVQLHHWTHWVGWLFGKGLDTTAWPAVNEWNSHNNTECCC